MMLGSIIVKATIAQFLFFQIADGSNGEKRIRKTVSFSGCDQRVTYSEAAELNEETQNLDDGSELDLDYLVDWLMNLKEIEEITVKDEPRQQIKPHRNGCLHQ
jgi:hypothetical protein